MKLSLIKKTALIIICIGIVVGVVAIAIYNKGMYDVVIEHYERYSIDVSKLVAVEIDFERLSNVQKVIVDIYKNSESRVMSDQWGTPEFEAYTSQFESVYEMDDYKAILADLRRMQDQLDVDCLYLTWVDVDNYCYIYLIDAACEDPCPVGCIDPIYLDNKEEAVKNVSIIAAPNITNTKEYGWLMATGKPILDSNGDLLAILDVDISMNEAMAKIVKFMQYIGISFAILVALVCVVSILLINILVVKPIKTLSRAASDYKGNKKAFSEMHIKRKDEIGALAESMVQMEKDIDKYVNDLSTAREQAEIMDRAANMDALTKVHNKRAYYIEAKRLDENKCKYGIVLLDLNDLKGINDNYGHEKGDISIQTVCNIVCQVFNPMSVYRVGGDEFIVILEDGEFENREELVTKVKELFKQNESNDSLSPWERVSAAVGYAVYDPNSDEHVAGVMQRADAEMYENKKEMKANKK